MQFPSGGHKNATCTRCTKWLALWSSNACDSESVITAIERSLQLNTLQVSHKCTSLYFPCYSVAFAALRLPSCTQHIHKHMQQRSCSWCSERVLKLPRAQTSWSHSYNDIKHCSELNLMNSWLKSTVSRSRVANCTGLCWTVSDFFKKSVSTLSFRSFVRVRPAWQNSGAVLIHRMGVLRVLWKTCNYPNCIT